MEHEKKQLDKSNFRHIQKYRKIQDMYNKLYNSDRKRLDDVLLILEKEFMLCSERLRKIVNFKLPSQKEIDLFIKENKPKAIDSLIFM